MKKIYTILVCLCMLAGFVACEKDKDFVLTTLTVQNETITPSYGSATIDCSFKADATISEAFVQYALSSSFAKYDVAKMTEEKGKYAAQLTDLQDNTTYYIRYAVSNKYSSAVTEEVMEFQTLQCTAPTIALDSIADVWDNRAKAYLHLIFDGGASVTDMGICWSKQTHPTIEDIHKSTKDTVAVLDMTDLQPNTTYYIRAYAVNRVGVSYSEEQEFTTYALPEVRTEEVANIQENTALLSATLVFDGNDTATIKGFCWSDKANPTIEANHIAIDTASVHYTYVLTDLLPATEYHVRAYATNRIGIVYGEELVFTTQSNQPPQPTETLPTVNTTVATQITATTAVTGGNVTNDGGAEVTERGVCIATISNPTTANTKILAGSGTGEFTCDITGLQEGTKYYVRAYAVNSVGTAYGEEVVFTTSVTGVPTVSTTQPSQITETTAVAGGNVTSDGGASVSERGVVYSISANPAITDLSSTIVRSGKGTGAFTCNLSNLQAGTTYYVRAYATNSKGTAYGDEISFTTALPITLAIVTTASITQITKTTAVAGGTVTNDGNASVTERGVCIATVSNPTTAHTKISAGSGIGMFTCNLKDLQPNTKYYVRAYAVNEKGTAYGEEVTFITLEEVSISNPTGTENGYGYVDLGLSVKWATYNVGANKPEEYGDYFAWGEIDSKNEYYWTNYKWCNGSETTITKYNNSSSYGTVDNKTSLELSDDAARANWGGNWRIPTDEEWTELREQCIWTWTTYNGVKGYVVTNNSSNHSIFLPAAGYQEQNSFNSEGVHGRYWSRSLNTDCPHNAWRIYFGYSGCFRGNIGRYYGFTVRSVLGENKVEITVSTVITTTVTQITETSAVAGGNVTSDGGASVTERGVVYSTNPNPVITNLNNTIRPCGSGTGSFTYNMTGLQSGTTYYVRAYAKNDAGTAYGEEVSFTTKEQSSTPSNGTENGYAYVDLGLSVKWATMNVGASKAEDYGGYYAWGETTTKSIYNWSTYKYCNGSYDSLTKYNTYSSYGTVDNKTTLELSDDAAYKNWGGSWRMPTVAEWTELREQCTWTWTTQNGVNGYKVTSKKSGYTNNSIFLPAAGYRNDSSLSNAGSYGDYWSSSLGTDSPYRAWRVRFLFNFVGRDYFSRGCGLSVRPVLGENKVEVTTPTVTTTTVTQITETTAVAGGNVTSDGGASVTERGVVYSTNPNPVITNLNNTIRPCGSGTGAFTYNMTGLQSGTTYYVRAYAKNDAGTAYGEEVSFTTKEESSTPSNGTENGHEYIDLGLSVKWATMNVGASKAEDYGGYYAWGETTTKSTYSWSNYKYCYSFYNNLTKYNTYSSYGTVDNKTTLELSDDVARVNWGEAWRIPTDAEWTELREQCTWIWTTQNGVNGYKITSKSNSNSIFLPASGYHTDSKLNAVGSDGCYWANSISLTLPYCAWRLNFNSNEVKWNGDNRYYGQSVRPVCP